MMSGGLAVLCLLLLHAGVWRFGLLPGKSLNHLEITEKAILNSTVQLFRALAHSEGTDFTFPAQPLTAEGVAVACGAQKSSKSFRKAITFITLRMQALNASFHYDEEMFVQGRKIITEGILAVKASNKQGNFEAAKQKLGEIFHPLQVNFMITGSTVFNRQRRSDDKQQRSNITASGVQLYRDLAQASGGQAIEVSKSELPVATSIITESSSSSLVTLLQAARNPGKPNNFTFMVDETVIKLTVYITGRSLSFTLISPTGDTA